MKRRVKSVSVLHITKNFILISTSMRGKVVCVIVEAKVVVDAVSSLINENKKWHNDCTHYSSLLCQAKAKRVTE